MDYMILMTRVDNAEILSSILFPIESKPYGFSYGQWIAKWWQWLLSIPLSTNPAFDETGVYANINQSDRNVLFLCQTFSDGRAATGLSWTRKICLKKGSSLLLPFINWISVLQVDGNTIEEIEFIARKKMDAISALEIKIDDVTFKTGLEQYRAKSPLFAAVLPNNNILGLSGGLKYFISDGYWMFLKKTEKDSTISTFGSCSSGQNRFAINYRLKVSD